MFRKKIFEVNYESCRTYNTNSQTKFKTSMLKLGLCNYIDVYIHVNEIIRT